MPPDAVVEIIDTPPPAPPPVPKTEIHVTPDKIDLGPMPDEPKPGSARAKMFEALRAKSKNITEPTAEPKAEPEAKPSTEKKAEAKPAEAKVPEAVKPEEAKPEEKPLTAEEKKKVNPWKLVDTYKADNSKLQAEIAKLKTTSIAEKERTELVTRAEKAEARAKALEDHMRYVDYSQTEEFQKQYQEPYDKAWMKHMKELGEIRVQMNEGEPEQMKADHLLALVNLGLEEAQDLAESMNPRFAHRLMAARQEIRDLFVKQSEALDDAKKNGAARIKQVVEAKAKTFGEISKFVTDNWTSANDSIVRDEKYGLYFTPVEGDENVNQRLAKGFELVDRAFSEDPNNEKLSPDERRSIIKRHAAVRHRAAAFGRLVYELDKERQSNKELQEELKKYRGSTPPTGGSPKSTTETPKPSSARESVFEALRAKAR